MPKKEDQVVRFKPSCNCYFLKRYWDVNKAVRDKDGDWEGVYEWREGEPLPTTHMEAVDPVPPSLHKQLADRDAAILESRLEIAEAHRKKVAANSGISADIEALRLQNQAALLEIQKLRLELKVESKEKKKAPAKKEPAKKAVKKTEPAGASALE